MKINKIKDEASIIFEIEGRIDTSTAPELGTQLQQDFENTKNIVLDFKDVAYVSSAGLRILLLGEKMARSKDGSMTLKNVSENVMEVFNMTGFSNVLNIQ